MRHCGGILSAVVIVVAVVVVTTIVVVFVSVVYTMVVTFVDATSTVAAGGFVFDKQSVHLSKQLRQRSVRRHEIRSSRRQRRRRRRICGGFTDAVAAVASVAQCPMDVTEVQRWQQIRVTMLVIMVRWEFVVAVVLLLPVFLLIELGAEWRRL